MYKSPIQSSILWLTNSFEFLNPFSFSILSSFTTIAFSRDPPLARPFFLIISISSNKQKVLELKYENSLIGNQKNKINVYEDDLKDIFDSRRFCLFEDIEKIKKNGLAKGGNLENAIVVKGNEILNTEKLRNPKEFVNHKILDCIGDLYTSGYRIIASINCSQGGHFLTNQLLKKVFENKENFSIIEIQERNLPHTIINKNLLRSIA